MEKQIEEIKELADGIFVNCQACLLELECNMIARYVIEEQGYRKASDVAREIFAEIEENMTDIRMEFATLRAIGKRQLAKIKEKYESEETE